MQIRTRNDLIKWLEDSAPCQAIKRALVYGTNENLGGFEQVLSGIDPGWIVKVTSKFNKIWYIAIKLWVNSRIFPGYRAYILEKVPWKNWAGEHAENPLYQGDHPKKYKLLRDKEIENATTKRK